MINKYYHTVRHLKLIQIYGQLAVRIKKPAVNLALPPAVRPTVAHWIEPILKAQQLQAPKKLCFLNQEKDISPQNIWSDAQVDRLWLYNLHYFDVINSYLVNPDWCADLIGRWIKENPPLAKGGWEPYPLSLRMVNWIKWMLAGNLPTPELLQSLAVQARYLCKRIEIHLLGNHILANAKALLFVGLFFTGKEANFWFKKGFKLFTTQLREQILRDGGHFELSPMYHSTILEDLLDVFNLFKTYEQPIPSQWLTTCENMFNWLQQMCHQDGDIAFFNDAVLKVAPTLMELEKYGQQLSVKQATPPLKKLNYFPDTGYCRMQRNQVLLLADVGNIGPSYQPGHGHADVLSFELSLGLIRLMVNSGTSCYSESAERIRQRGSRAHNALVVNQLNSSEIWKSFRVGRRAKAHNICVNELEDRYILTASHDGYKKINKICHTRTWQLSDNELLIEDVVSGRGGLHHIELNFHIHPEITLQQEGKIIFFFDSAQRAIAYLEINAEIQIVSSTYHPEFNISIPNKKIVAEVYQSLPVRLNTAIKFKV